MSAGAVMVRPGDARSRMIVRVVVVALLARSVAVMATVFVPIVLSVTIWLKVWSALTVAVIPLTTRLAMPMSSVTVPETFRDGVFV